MNKKNTQNQKKKIKKFTDLPKLRAVIKSDLSDWRAVHKELMEESEDEILSEKE